MASAARRIAPWAGKIAGGEGAPITSAVDIQEFLATVRGFDRLPPEALARLASRAQLHRHAPGERLIRRGDRERTMYVLHRGRVRVPLSVVPGHLEDSVELGPRAVFGELAMLSDGKRTADVVAIEEVDAISFERDAIEPLLWDHPDLALVLTELVAHRLARTREIQRVGPYRIGEQIGRGGTSVVFAGHHEGTGAPVAIKMLDHRLAYDRGFRERFLLEARTAGELEHPHIVRVLDTRLAFATCFLVMERADGVDLRTLLRRRGPLPEARARNLVAQIAAALEHAHAHGVVHRDVKPSNCLVDAAGHLRLTDFGIATRSDTRASAGDEAPLGTPRYMAPEVIDGARATPAADWYGLGVLAFELLVGEPPFTSRDKRVLLEEHRSRPPALERLDLVASPDLRRLVAGWLTKDPGARTVDPTAARVVLGTAGPGGLSLGAGTFMTDVAPTVDIDPTEA